MSQGRGAGLTKLYAPARQLNVSEFNAATICAVGGVKDQIIVGRRIEKQSFCK